MRGDCLSAEVPRVPPHKDGRRRSQVRMRSGEPQPGFPPGAERPTLERINTMPKSYPVISPPKDRTWTAAPALLAGENRRDVNSREVLDLRHNCPVCGKPYQPGEAVLALASLCLGPGEGQRTAAPGGDQSSELILGHHGCVLPRLLTLVASFEPGRRFVDAVNDLRAGMPGLPEHAERDAFLSPLARRR
jgi:hypothetical protein